MNTLQRTTGRAVRQLPKITKPLIFRRDWHKDYNSSKEEQSFKLPDGRTMGFAEYGDFKGIPIFAFHGAPGSRYDGRGLHDLAVELGIRIVFPDRPGHGLSTFQPNRKYLDYPGDISCLAKHLNIPKYHVAGQSGGGPFVIACAHSSPKEELLSATVIAGMAPPAVLTLKDAGLYTMAVLWMRKWAPSPMRWFCNWSLASEQRIKSQLGYMLWMLPKSERETLGTPEAMDMIVKHLQEAYAQGVDGTFHEMDMMMEPWGFELDEVEREVKLFYGKADNRTPIAFGRYLAEHLPNAVLTEFEDSSHFTIEKHDREVMTSIIGSK